MSKRWSRLVCEEFFQQGQFDSHHFCWTLYELILSSAQAKKLPNMPSEAVSKLVSK